MMWLRPARPTIVNRKASSLLLSSVIACAIALSNVARADAAEPASATPLWAAEMKTLAGGELQSLGQFKGKVAVIYFWASWCAPCHAEAPKLEMLQAQMKDKGVVVVGVAIDNAEKAQGFVEKHKLTFPNFLSGTAATGGTNGTELTKQLGNEQGAIPFLVVTGKDGEIAATVKGDSKDTQRLEEILAPLTGS